MSFLKMRTQSALKRNKCIRTNVPYSQAKSFGIIFSVEDREKHEVIKEFAKRLELDGKQVRILEYLPLKKENYEFLFDFFTVKDLSFWGKILSDQANKFIDTPFDYLFYIDRESNPLILNLLARSKAMCRVGRFHVIESPFFEFMIEQNGTTRGLIDTMYKYSKQLR